MFNVKSQQLFSITAKYHIFIGRIVYDAPLLIQQAKVFAVAHKKKKNQSLTVCK